MSSTIESISSVAVWGSLSASLVLGSFFTGQSFLNPPKRSAYLLLAFTCFITAIIDLIFPLISLNSYELLRVISWPLLSAATIYLFQANIPHALLAYFFPLSLGITALSFKPEIATTVTLPVVFMLNAICHLNEYKKRNGFGSCVLFALSTIQATQCALYYQIVSIGEPLCTSLGYLHYSLTTVMIVILGWVNIPRELNQKAPVKIKNLEGKIFIFSIFIMETIILLPFVLTQSVTTVLYCIGTIGQAIALSIFYFSYRHQLVIYTENVTELLEQRTASLQEARNQLTALNAIQADKLEEQALGLKEKSSVIERQRRLELAAQTAGQAAHDIQNLVSPILHFIKDLEINAEDPKKITDSSTKVKKIVSELLELNSQILAMSRRGRVESESISIVELLNDIAQRFPKNSLSVEISDHCWTKGSWSQLSRAFSNLVVNAQEADGNSQASIKVSKEIISETKKCHLGYLLPGEYCLVQVADSGSGIPLELQEKIFEPFFSSKSGKTKSGSGLGLSIVSAVIDDHFGVIDLKTGSNGTIFYIYLPLHNVKDDIESAWVDNGKILVVDDDENIRTQLNDLLTSVGYDVYIAADGREALHLLNNTEVDAIILDYSLPGLNANQIMLGLYNIIKMPKVIIYSSFLTDSQAAELKSLGVMDILSKPTSFESLRRALYYILHTKSST